MKRLALIAVLSAGLTLGLAACAPPPSVAASPGRDGRAEAVRAAIHDPRRPDADRERDALRLPFETLAFAGAAPGQAIGEYMPGGGYFSRLLAHVAGGQGRLHVFVPEEIVRLRPAYLDEARAFAAEPGMERVGVLTGPTAAFAAPEPLDLVFTAQNYHDLYGPYAPQGAGSGFDRAVFAALKPGGLYVIVDHHAAAGTGLAGAGALHRIERAAVIRAVTMAGFVLDGEDEALFRADDPLTASVFDPAIRGRTSQFMLRFRKPE